MAQQESGDISVVHIKFANPARWACFAKERGHRKWRVVYSGRSKNKALEAMGKAFQGTRWFRVCVGFIEPYYDWHIIAEAKRK